MGIPKMRSLKPTYAMKRQLAKTIYDVIDRLETMEQTNSLYNEVQRAAAYNLITPEDFKEMTRRLDAVIEEMKQKENVT